MIRESILCVVVVLGLFAGACGGGDGGDAGGSPTPTLPSAEIESFFARVVESYNAGDAGAFTAAFTDAGLAQFFDASDLSRAELEALAEGLVGLDEVTIMEVRSVVVSGDTATAELLARVSNTISLESYTLVRRGGAWLIDGSTLLDPEVPQGVTNVVVAADEFSFDFDPGAISDGNVAFTLENVGVQEHELGLALVTADFDIGRVVAADPESTDLPPGIIDIVGGTIAAPGESRVLLFAEDLAPGPYAMLCFLPDEATQQPHAALGMYAEFEVPES